MLKFWGQIRLEITDLAEFLVSKSRTAGQLVGRV